jgi:large subunit ribosomal protein L29
MNIQEIRGMSDEEILNTIEDKKASLFFFRRDRVTGELKDTNLMRYAKRDVARLKTVLHERQLAAKITASGDAQNTKEKGNG